MKIKINFEQYFPKKEDYGLAKEALDYIIPILEKVPNKYDIFIGGSYAKGTWLGKDIDIFVRFPKSFRGKNISKYVKETLDKEKVNYILIHGSRDYFRVPYKGLTLEIVPILKIDDPKEKEFITDVSPFHVEWVKEHIKGLEEDVKKFKVFNKVIGTYGAESYIGGFSGYACELLVIYYKGFEKLLKASLEWKPKVFIDIEGYYKSLEEALKVLSKDKTKSPIILIDPVEKDRNATASLSYKNFASLILNAHYFLKEGFVVKYSVEELANELKLPYLEIYLDLDIEKEDILGAKLTKYSKSISNFLEKYGIITFYSEVEVEEKKIKLLLSRDKLDRYYLHYGPPAWVRNRENFLEKHPLVFVTNDGRLVTLKREERDLEKLVEWYVKQYIPNVKNYYVKLINQNNNI